MMWTDLPRTPRASLATVVVLALCASTAMGQHVSAVADPRAVVDMLDFTHDGAINFLDFSVLAAHWDQNEPSLDVAATPPSDGVIDLADLALLTSHWLTESSLPVNIQWLDHSSVKIWSRHHVVYVDPRNIPAAPHDADIVLVTHTHSDHFSPSDITRVSTADTILLAPPDVIASYGSGQALAPGQTRELDGVIVTGVPAYNTNKPNHPRANNWLGYIVELASKRIYCAGDTDLIEEMKTLGDIDVAILPAGGSFTMNALEAAQATAYIQPQLAIPYHWGQIVGTLRDAETFARFAACEVKIMGSGEILSSQDWHHEFSLLAHWRLDEREGDTATDSVGSAHGTLSGPPDWRPSDGAVGGALQFDGQTNYIRVPAVLSPADGPLSIFAWVKCDSPGKVILSQEGGVNWLLADATGYLGTGLTGTGRRSAPLWSQTLITDSQWRRVGLVWTGAERILYVDDIEVARDTQSSLTASRDDLLVGAGATLEPAAFFSGMIDDIRFYRRGITPP